MQEPNPLDYDGLVNDKVLLAERQESFDHLTVDLVRQCLPRHLSSSATEELTDKLNNIAADPVFGRTIRENFISYSRILGEGRFKLEDYLSAVVYVSYKLMGYSNDDAYIRTFPERYQVLVEKGVDTQTRSAYVAAFHRGKLVNLIMEQTLIPVHVLYQDVQMESIRTLTKLMRTASSERIQMESAATLMQHLKAPEDKQINLNISTQESEGMLELKGLLQNLAAGQMATIKQGVPAKLIAQQKLVDGEYTEVLDDPRS